MWASIGWGGLSYFGGLMLDRLGFGASYVTYGLMSIPCLFAIARLKYGSGSGARDSSRQEPSPRRTKVHTVPRILPLGQGCAPCDCKNLFCIVTVYYDSRYWLRSARLRLSSNGPAVLGLLSAPTAR